MLTTGGWTGSVANCTVACSSTTWNGEDVGDGRDAALRNDLRQLLSERFLSLNPGLEFADTDNLVDLGVLDSLAFVELVDEVQQRYGISVNDDEITETNFGSIAAIGDYVERRRPR